MSNREKFDPVINRISLCPEQAVLNCEGYDVGTPTAYGYIPGTGNIVSVQICYTYVDELGFPMKGHTPAVAQGTYVTWNPNTVTS